MVRVVLTESIRWCFPLVLGRGTRLFGATETPKPFRLVESKAGGNELEAR